ncbi:MAG TPA: isochorismatase family protein [Bryobacteraceae bacterium]|nr:isochorismatase family protein [Bryobacteraceae bacterium]
MNAFFDIDTQIDFLFPAGALYAPGAERLIPTIAALNRHAVEKGYTLISTVCAHPENAEEFKVWPPHCVLGTVGQLKPAATLVGEKQIIFPKNELDPFSNPDLIPLLDSLGIEECTVYGVLTEYCVKHAAMGLLATGRKVRLLTNAIHHLSVSAANEMMAAFMAAGGNCGTTADYL